MAVRVLIGHQLERHRELTVSALDLDRPRVAVNPWIITLHAQRIRLELSISDYEDERIAMKRNRSRKGIHLACHAIDM